jgi:hypothetical protein
MEYVLGLIGKFVAVVLLGLTISLFVFICVELPRRGIMRLAVSLGGREPRNLRTSFFVAALVAALFGGVCLGLGQLVQGARTPHETIAGILMAVGGINLFAALTVGYQGLRNQQMEDERSVHEYQCPRCKRELKLSDLPAAPGNFKCMWCRAALSIVWHGDYATIFDRSWFVRLPWDKSGALGTSQRSSGN